MKKVFCQRLRELRGSLSQGRYADKIGTKQTTLSSWERGFREPNLDGVVLIATTNGVSTDWLLGLSDDRRGGTPAGADASTIDLQKRIHDLEVENAALQKALSLIGGHRAPVVKTGGSPAIKTA